MAVGLDPDGAVGPDPTRVVKLDGSAAQVYDLAQGKPVGAPLLHGGEILVAAFSPDGRLVATAARDRTARVWDAASGKPLTPPLHHGLRVVRAAFSADGRRLLTTTENGIVRVWELTLRGVMQPLPAPREAGPSAISPDGRLVADGDKAGWVEVRDAVSGKVVRGPWKLSGSISELAFAPDGRRVLAASDSGHQNVRLDADSLDRLATWMDTYAQRLGSFSEQQEQELLAFRQTLSPLLSEPLSPHQP